MSGEAIEVIQLYTKSSIGDLTVRDVLEQERFHENWVESLAVNLSGRDLTTLTFAQ